MTSRCRPLYVLCLIVLFLIEGGMGRSLSAQDRGAPRFGLAAGDTVAAQDESAGRLWEVAAPPFERFQSRYGIEADSAWGTHLRRGVLRLPNCTAALVSADGLALTTSRCVQQFLEREPPDEALVAGERGAERSLPGLYADRLVRVTDVTADVQAAVQEPGSLSRAAMSEVLEQLQTESASGERVRVVEAGGGSRYTAYTYRRYETVRLVFRPERSLSAFGGIASAFTYPRHTLDAALIRVYTSDGNPLTPEHFFEPASQGARPGDAVISVGHPERTHRAESTDQLAVRRDVVLPTRRRMLQVRSRAGELDQASSSGSASRRTVFETQRALKSVEAHLTALQNDELMRRLQHRDAQFQQVLQQDPDLNDWEKSVLDSLAVIQKQKRELASAYRAFAPLRVDASGSATLRRAVLVHRAREVSGTERDSLLRRMESITPVPNPVETALVTEHVEALQSHFESDSAVMQDLLQGASPAQRAASLVEHSVLVDSVSLEAVEGLPAEDPALALVGAFWADYESFRAEWERLSQAEQELTARLARARDQLGSSAVLPAANRAPRLTDGRVRGYPYNGTTAPPFTTFYGLYGESRAFDGAEAWSLPDRWHNLPTTFDRSVPLSLAASTDPVAGSDGAPLLNRHLEIVGVAGDPNIEGRAGMYLYLPERMRTVATDLRALRQSLSTIYEAESLVDELFETSSGPENPSSR